MCTICSRGRRQTVRSLIYAQVIATDGVTVQLGLESRPVTCCSRHEVVQLSVCVKYKIYTYSSRCHRNTAVSPVLGVADSEGGISLQELDIEKVNFGQ